VRLAVSILATFLPIPAAWPNYSHQHRPASAVRLVVVHVTEGSFAAANYVVGRNGEIAHMVPDDEVAWHAGNGWVNEHSIGIEHEGYSRVDGVVTDAEYRASAQLVASLLRRYHLPADRRHVIGHSEVADPFHRGLFGGWAHHTDPGAYWDWTRYMTYVRDYRAGVTPPPLPVDVTIPDLELGQHVSGLVSWVADATNAAHVDFVVDGAERASVDTAPYVWAWDTSLERPGRHVLTARAVAADGRSAISSVVLVSQARQVPPPVVALPELPPLTGVVEIDPILDGRVASLELWIDGSVVQTVSSAPYMFTLDTSTLTPGQHTLAVRAIGPTGAARAAITQVQVPEPTPAPAP
jgi:N-acetylmuramoyl-L-alanine amidase-like protein/Big-like domain-containing protein